MKVRSIYERLHTSPERMSALESVASAARRVHHVMVLKDAGDGTDPMIALEEALKNLDEVKEYDNGA